MRVASCVLAALLAAPAVAPAVDYGAIDRTIEREPTYRSNRPLTGLVAKPPLYALLLFGPDAKARVWVVLDGDTVYLDRNADGDLTAADEKFAGVGAVRGVSVRDPDGTTTYVITGLGVHEAKDQDGKPVRSLMPSVTVRGPVEYRQYGDVFLAPSAAAAKVCHFGGPLSARPKEVYWKLPPGLKLQTGDQPTDLRLLVGTLDAEHGCWAVVTSHTGKSCDFPDRVRPTVEVEYPPKAPGGPAVRRKYVLDGFC